MDPHRRSNSSNSSHDSDTRERGREEEREREGQPQALREFNSLKTTFLHAPLVPSPARLSPPPPPGPGEARKLSEIVHSLLSHQPPRARCPYPVIPLPPRLLGPCLSPSPPVCLSLPLPAQPSLTGLDSASESESLSEVAHCAPGCGGQVLGQ
jgi:hypothetical protein